MLNIYVDTFCVAVKGQLTTDEYTTNAASICVMKEPTLYGSLDYIYVLGSLIQEHKLQACGTVLNNDTMNNEIYLVKNDAHLDISLGDHATSVTSHYAIAQWSRHIPWTALNSIKITLKLAFPRGI